MPRPGSIQDRGARGYEIRDKVIKTQGGAWFEPTGSVVAFDDFLGKALNATDYWTVTETGTPSAALAVDGDAGQPTAGHGGWIAGATEAADNAAWELALTNESVKGQFFATRAGNGMMVFETVLNIPTALTARIYNAGFTDDETEGGSDAAAAFYDTVTWTTTATDAVLWNFTSLSTVPAWRGIGVKNNVDSPPTGSYVLSSVAAASATATKLRIEIDSSGNAFWFHSDQLAGGVVPVFQGSSKNAVTTTVEQIPYVSCGSTTTTAAPLQCDYVFAAVSR